MESKLSSSLPGLFWFTCGVFTSIGRPAVKHRLYFLLMYDGLEKVEKPIFGFPYEVVSTPARVTLSKMGGKHSQVFKNN